MSSRLCLALLAVVAVVSGSERCDLTRRAADHALDFALEADAYDPAESDGGSNGVWLRSLLDLALSPSSALAGLSGASLIEHIVPPSDESSACAVEVATALSAELVQLRTFMVALARHHRGKASTKSVVIVGAGPGGLLSALESLRAGASVELLEARTAATSYKRIVWFDVMPSTEDEDEDEVASGSGIGAAEGVVEETFRVNVAPGVDMLSSLGLMTQRERDSWLVRHDGWGGLTLRCSTLERFLAKVLLILGVRVRFGSPFVGACISVDGSGEQRAVALVHRGTGPVPGAGAAAGEARCRAEESCTGEGVAVGANGSDTRHRLPPRCDALPEEVELSGASAWTKKTDEGHGTRTRFAFDLLVGADGARSAVRAYWGASFDPQTRFTRRDMSTVDVPGLHQPSVLLKLRAVAVGGEGHRVESESAGDADEVEGAASMMECPEMKDDSSPFDPAMTMPASNATSLWRRFFGAECEMQVLFRVGTRALARGTSRDDLLSALLPIVNGGLESPFADVAELAASTISVRPFNIEIGRAVPDSGAVRVRSVLDGAAQAEGQAAVEASAEVEPLARWVLIGDASVTAHYRLGIGINTIFRSMASLGAAVAALRDNATADAAAGAPVEEESETGTTLLTRWQRSSERRSAWMVQTQLSSIWAEAYCGFATYKSFIYRVSDEGDRFVAIDSAEEVARCPSPPLQ